MLSILQPNVCLVEGTQSVSRFATATTTTATTQRVQSVRLLQDHLCATTTVPQRSKTQSQRHTAAMQRFQALRAPPSASVEDEAADPFGSEKEEDVKKA